jgi:ATP-dependent Clp protease ATP-binding subunit ClpB
VRPEFINRIDDIVLFTPLTKSDIEEIVSLQIGIIKKMIAEQNIQLEATSEAMKLLATKGFDPQFGARPVKRILQKLVLNKLSKEILSNKIQSDDVLLLDAFDQELVFRNQS